jgi:hypothetical protein
MFSHELIALQCMLLLCQIALSASQRELLHRQHVLLFGQIMGSPHFRHLMLSALSQVLGGVSQSLGSAVQQDSGDEQAPCKSSEDKSEYCYPGVGLKPEYLALGGWGLCCLGNGLGT